MERQEETPIDRGRTGVVPRTHLEAKIAHIKLGNLNVLLCVLHQTPQAGLTRQQISFVLQMFQLVQPALPLRTGR